ncbi:MAG: hypothetical protein ACREV4_12885 [Gammaproteobacteria bacterium]
MDNKTETTRVDRKTASEINPAISDEGPWGTCQNVSLAMRAIGNEVALDAINNASVFSLLQEMLAAALTFEIYQDLEAKRSEHTP